MCVMCCCAVDLFVCCNTLFAHYSWLYNRLYTWLQTVQYCYVDSGVGAGIDSYYEYLLKAYIMLGDETYLDRFNKVVLLCSLVLFLCKLTASDMHLSQKRRHQTFGGNC